MYHIQFEVKDSYPVAILVKTDALTQTAIQTYYIDPMVSSGVSQDSFIAFSLEYGNSKKPSASYMKTYLADLLEELDAAYPGYGLAAHKGYGTAAHIQALQRLGPTPQHRLSFAPVAQAALRMRVAGV